MAQRSAMAIGEFIPSPQGWLLWLTPASIGAASVPPLDLVYIDLDEAFDTDGIDQHKRLVSIDARGYADHDTCAAREQPVEPRDTEE